MKKYSWADKVGFGLVTEDIPDNYDQKVKVLSFEGKTFIRTLEEGANQAWLDTTFALYAPNIPHSVGPRSIRTSGAYMAHHLPWYRSREDFTEEDHYYHQSCRPDCGFWTNLSHRGVEILATPAPA